MILGALQDVGGQAYLAKRALDCPTAFLALVGRVLPLQLAGANGQPLNVDFRWADEVPASGEGAGPVAGLSAQHARTQPLTIDGEPATIQPLDSLTTERGHD